MSIKERYDKIIQYIEEQYEGTADQYKKTRDLAEEIAANEGMTYRDMNTSFKFITGMTLQDYIRHRRLMAVYKDINMSNEYVVDQYIEKSGYSDQANFGKAFGERFTMSPKALFKSKDNTLYEKPLNWEGLSDSEDINEDVENPIKTDTLFGIDRNVLKKYEEVRELQCLFEFDNVKSEICFRVSDNYGVPLRRIFEYMDEFIVNDNVIYGNDIDEKYINFTKGKYNHFMLLKFTDWSIDQMDANLALMKAGDEKRKIVIEESDKVIIDLWQELYEYDFYELRYLYNTYKEENTGIEHFIFLLEYITPTGHWEEDLKNILEQDEYFRSVSSNLIDLEEEKSDISINAYLDNRDQSMNRDKWKIKN